MKTRDEFYRDEICCEVARVYSRGIPELRQTTWAIGPGGKPFDADLSKRQCDYLIGLCGGDVAKAEETAIAYMCGGIGMAG